MKQLNTPIHNEDIRNIKVGDVISISGYIYTGRDAVLPKIVKHAEAGSLSEIGVDLEGQVIFHTAVSPAGVGPTSSNKLEIETSFEPLSRHGIRLFLGKGAISKDTVEAISKNNAIFAVIPPVTALLGSNTSQAEIVCYPELGMEAFHKIKINNYQAIVAAANGESIYD